MGKTSNKIGASVNPLEVLPALVSAVDTGSGSGGSGDNDVYNWGDSNTRRLASSLAKARAGTGYSDHVVIGDGQTAGYISGMTRAQVWPTVLRDRLDWAGYRSGGTGWVRPSTGYATNLDPRVTKTGTWDFIGANVPYLRATTSGATLTFASDANGTAVDVAYYRTSAAFDVSVDGGAAVTVTPSGDPSSSMGVYSVTGLSNGTHTVTVTTTSTSATFIVGFQCRPSFGVRVHNFGADGATTSVFATTAFDTLGGTVSRLVPDPDVVHLAIGFNDDFAAVPVSTTIANLNAIRAKWPNADVILHAPYQASTSTNWPNYVTALYGLADSLNCPLVDVYRSSRGYAIADSNGLMTNVGGGGSTKYYPSADGHSWWAMLAASRISLSRYSPSAPMLYSGGTVTDYITLNSAGRESVPRPLCNTTLTLANQTMRFSCWTETQTRLVTTAEVVSGGTAGVGLTLARIGLCTVDSSGGLTLVASTANDTALFVSKWSKDLSAEYILKPGTRYAAVVLVAGGTTQPNIVAQGYPVAALPAKSPRISGFVSSQNDLPSSVVAGLISDTTTVPYVIFR